MCKFTKTLYNEADIDIFNKYDSLISSIDGIQKKDKLIQDVNGTLIQKYQLEGNVITLVSHEDVDCVYLDSNIDIENYITLPKF